MSPTLTLRRPREDEEAEFLRAHLATSPDVPTFLHHYEEGMAFPRYLEVLGEHEQGINLPSAEYVPSTFLFAFAEPRIVGRVTIRHRLNEFLMREGGHIGYVVVPEFRRRGYATAMLGQAIVLAREQFGIGRILVTCYDANIGSIKAIERNGGVLEDVVPGDSGQPLRRYWIEPALH